ncbi:hypothetical protein AB3N58_15725 [Leptospira sp. WS60.C2]
MKNFTENLKWGMYPEIKANSATSPANVLFLSILTFLTKNPEISILLQNFLLLFTLFIALNQISEILKINNILIYLLIPLIILNPFLFSSLGLESFSVITVFILFFISIMKIRLVLAGILLGILFILRPDSILLGIPFIFLLKSKKQYFLLSFSALISTIPWLLYSYINMGSLLPDTLIIKRTQSSWDGYNFFNGFTLYWINYKFETFLAIFPIFSALVLIFKNRKNIAKEDIRINNPILLLSFAGVLHFVIFGSLHVPPYHWYYVFSLVLITISCTLFYLKIRLDGEKILPIILISIWLISILFSFSYAYKSKEMPIHTNWINKDEYKKISEELDLFIKERQFVKMNYEIGTLAYYSKNSIFIDDFSSRYLIQYMCMDIKKLSFKNLNKIMLSLTCLNRDYYKNAQDKLPSYKYEVSHLSNQQDSIEFGPYNTRWSKNVYLYLNKLKD